MVATPPHIDPFAVDETLASRDSMQGARHAVAKTLYSRAHRIGEESASCFLGDLKQRTSVGLRLVAVVICML